MLRILVTSYLFFYSHVRWWCCGDCWGPRFVVQLLPFPMFGLAALIDHAHGPRTWIRIGVATIISVVIRITSVLVSYIPYLEEMVKTPAGFDRLLWNPAYSPAIVQADTLSIINILTV